ncbi:MAG: suppressor of fused domain protein [Armatimonadetes bacterium]|nr:suppressor of fused domain protein [Armatimonadota bacterium]
MSIIGRLFGKKETSPSGIPIIRHRGEGKRALGFPNIPDEWQGIREEFYKQHFGDFDTVSHEIVMQQPHIDIYPCKPDPAQGRNYYTFVTGGMSDLPMKTPAQAPPEARRAELIMYVSEADVEKWHSENVPFPQGFIHMIATIPHGYKSWFGRWHTMPIGNPPEPILPGSQLTTVLFVPPEQEPPYVRNGLKLGKEQVSFLWVVLITDAECELKLKQGGEALWKIMKDNNHPVVLDMMRRSYV